MSVPCNKFTLLGYFAKFSPTQPQLLKNIWFFKVSFALKVNLTFLYFKVGWDATYDPLSCTIAPGLEKMLVSPIYHYKCEEQDRLFSVYYIGKRNIFNIISQYKYLNITLWTFPVRTLTIDILFVILDERLADKFVYFNTYNTIHQGKFYHHEYQLNLLKSKVHMNAFHIAITKLRKLTIVYAELFTISSLIVIYDGPGPESPKVKISVLPVIMSSFQCYIILYLETMKNMDPRLFNISISSVKISHQISKIISYRQQITANHCNYFTISPNLYCVFNLTAEDKYLNISLGYLSYTGPQMYNCSFGGIAYYQFHSNLNEYFEVRSMCDDFTNDGEYDINKKKPMDFVSEESNMLIIIYSYWPYTTLEFVLNVAIAPCKGVIPCLPGGF